jgi:prepilin-type N-terminal cleavage/methylation domain-containing protein
MPLCVYWLSGIEFYWEQPLKITKTKGFTLLELMIVLTIFGIMASMASFSYQRYVNNTKLRTAARDLVTNINRMKGKAVANMNVTYTISFNKTANTYTMTNPDTVDGTQPVEIQLTSSDYGSAYIFSLPGGGSNYTLTFLARGTLNPSSGTLWLKNNRGSDAKIVFNFTGKTYVTFAMQ